MDELHELDRLDAYYATEAGQAALAAQRDDEARAYDEFAACAAVYNPEAAAWTRAVYVDPLAASKAL